MNKRKLNKHRQFSEQICRKAGDDFRRGKHTVKELADLYHCSLTAIYKWIHKYLPTDSLRIPEKGWRSCIDRSSRKEWAQPPTQSGGNP
jgi:transposase